MYILCAFQYECFFMLLFVYQLVIFISQQFLNMYPSADDKGQLIRNVFLVSSIFPKKRTKKFDLVPQVESISFVFWEELEIPKRHFEIN